MTSSARVPFLLVLVLLGSACTRKVGNDRCSSDRDCGSGEACDTETNACVPEDELARGCATDTDCDVSVGEICLNGGCAAGGAPAGGGCTVTADCPIDQFCNSATSACQPLLSGWCRDATQCGAGAPVCSAQSTAAPGRCVECLSTSDCGGAECVSPGICDGDNTVDPGPGPGTDPEPEPDPITCPPNASPSGVRCICDAGFVDDGTGGCMEDDGTTDPGADGDVCEEYGWYGDGVCDDFCPQPDTADCSGTDPGTDPGTNPGGGASCVEPEDCWAESIDYTCGAGGQCECDVAWMYFFVCDVDQDVDPASCTCTSGASSARAENESCIESGQMMECSTGLECIYATDSAGDPSYGSCKQVCQSNSQCGTGRQCALGFLSNGDGICGRPKTVDQTGCTFWDQGDTFCYDQNAPTGADDAFLECMDTRCEFLCDYEGNTGGAFQCPGTQTCGPMRSMSGFDVDVAYCE